MAIWIVLAVHIGQNGRVERVRWQREDGGRNASIGDPCEVDAEVVAGAIKSGDKVYTLKPHPCGTAVTEVRRVVCPSGTESIEFEDQLPSL
jgi:hypothetical protein